MWNLWRNDRELTQFWTVQTWAALVIWLRFLLYLRSVDKFSWMVRMITECITDMLPIFFIFFIGVLGFCDAFLSIDTKLALMGKIEGFEVADDPNYYEKYVQSYIIALQNAYLTSLGAFKLNLDFYSEVDWIVFFICTIFNVVLLLNLLVAIVCETFTRVASTKVETSYKEKVNQMCIMQSNIFGYITMTPKSYVDMLFIAQSITDSVKELTAHERIDALEKRIEEITGKIIKDTKQAVLERLDDFALADVDETSDNLNKFQKEALKRQKKREALK